MVNRLRRLWRLLEMRRRRQLSLAAALLMLSGLLEMLSLGLVLPLLLHLTRGGGGAREGLVLASLFCCVVLTAGGVRFLSLWCNSRLAGAVGSDLAEQAWCAILLLPYPEQQALDHSQVVAMLAPQLRQLIQLVLLQALYAVSAAALITGIAVVLLAMAWQAALPTLLVIGCSYWLLSRCSRGPLLRHGALAAADQRLLIRQLHDALASTRERILRSNAHTTADAFGGVDRRMRRHEANNAAITGLPRFLLEPLGIVTIVMAGLMLLSRGESPERVLPLLGVMAFASQRLLPLGQQLWSGWASVRSHAVLLDPLLPLLERPRPPALVAPPPLQGWRSAGLEFVSFSYDKRLPPVVSRIAFRLSRGEWLGLHGESGSGKTTVLDLLMGLLPAQAGALVVDGQRLAPASEPLRRWQAGIGYLGSGVSLTPGSLEQNICQERPMETPWLRQLVQWLELEPLLHRQLGEAGEQLSGGQRQRVGLARALYGKPGLLILDEATSALDLEAEQRLLRRLRQHCPDLSVVLVSHRSASLAICDRVMDSTAQLD
jgi:ATP-binding cassette subfamily B protein